MLGSMHAAGTPTAKLKRVMLFKLLVSVSTTAGNGGVLGNLARTVVRMDLQTIVDGVRHRAEVAGYSMPRVEKQLT